MKPIRAFAPVFLLLWLIACAAAAETLGPATSYNELRFLTEIAQNGDIILVSGDLDGTGAPPLTTNAAVRIFAEDGSASIRGLSLQNAAVTINGIRLLDTLHVAGESQLELGSEVSVVAGDGQNGIVFNGSGSLILDQGASIHGGAQGAGIVINHTSGEFYASLSGDVSGGSGPVGGPGVEIESLTGFGTLLISGNVSGGSGSSMGGHAVNLFGVADNAFVAVDGRLSGGNGPVGGHGLQIVSVDDNASIGVTGEVTGGQGEQYGGDGLILMNVGGASNVNLSGSFVGGSVTTENAMPGLSLMIADESSAKHAQVVNCNLRDGSVTPDETPVPETPVPSITPLPEIPAFTTDVSALPTPQPELDAPSQTPEPEQTEMPSDKPADVSTSASLAEATPSPTPTPTVTPMPMDEME